MLPNVAAASALRPLFLLLLFQQVTAQHMQEGSDEHDYHRDLYIFLTAQRII